MTTAVERARVMALTCFQKGHGFKFTAKQIGVAEATVHVWYRLFKDGRFDPVLGLADDSVPKPVIVIRMRKEGYTLPSIAAATGYSLQNVCRWVSKAIAEEQFATQLNRRHGYRPRS